MKTYQDLQKANVSEQKLIDFILEAIHEHKTSEMYEVAIDAEAYDRQENVTIMQYKKLLYTLSGKAVEDLYSPNHKIASNYFNFFTTQENQYLLGNGLHLDKDDNKTKLGKKFDSQLQHMGRNALVQGVSFGFWNFDKLEVFKLTEFVPLWDEETSALKAGIRFFQIDADKPLRATLYEPDGYTDFLQESGKQMKVLNKKQGYVKTTQKEQAAEVEEIVAQENYKDFPIIPMYGNEHHQSELVGLRQSIDAYDLIKSGFSNDMDGAHLYWLLKNSGGMDDMDLAKFMERLNILGVAQTDDETDITPHEIPIPYESRVAYLDRLEKDMYTDYQALNVTDLSAGNKTATEIRAAYQPLDNKTDQFEYCVLEFLENLFAIVGIEGENPSFTRNRVASQSDDMQTLLMPAAYLDKEYITEKACAILGDPDAAQEIEDRNAQTDVDRFLGTGEQNE